VARSGLNFTAQVAQLPAQPVLDEIDRLVDWQRLEGVLMEEGIAKFADPQKALLRLIAEKRGSLATS
jgi:transaldolase